MFALTGALLLAECQFAAGLSTGQHGATLGQGSYRLSSSPPIIEYPLPNSGSEPNPVTEGPDGNIWFLEYGTSKAGYITPSGAITEFSIPGDGGSNPPYNDIVTVSVGNLWFTEANKNDIAKLTTAGAVTEYSVPTSNANVDGIAPGSDGNVWFTENAPGKIGKVTPTGSFTEYSLPNGSKPQRITSGPDGNMWFTEYNGNIAKITSAGSITEYPIPDPSGDPEWITSGNDGNLWALEISSNLVDRVSISGTFTQFSVASQSGSCCGNGGIAAGPDGNVWFSEYASDKIASVTPEGVISEYQLPTAGAGPERLAVGSDHAIWFAEQNAGKIGRFAYDGPLGGAPRAAENPSGGNAAEPSLCAAQGTGGDPCNTATGTFSDTFADLSLPGRGVPLQISHTYSSHFAGVNGPLGYGWSISVGMNLHVDPSSGQVTVAQENGAQVTFSPASGGGYEAAPRVIATLVKNGDGTWTFVRDGQNTYAFSSSGLLTSENDLNGYTTTFAYNGNNQLTTVTDPAQRTVSIGWTGSNITSVTDANVIPARQVTLQYNDGDGDLTDVIDVDGGQTHFVYDNSHRLINMHDPDCHAAGNACNNGNGVIIHYNGSGQVDWQQDQLGRQTSFAYSGDPSSFAGGTTTVTNPKGNVTADTYQYGLMIQQTKGYGTPQAATWQYGYDPATLARVSEIDPDNHHTTFTVDGRGNQLSKTDPLLHTSQATYNAFNEPLTQTDPLGVMTTQTYDGSGNLQTVNRPLLDSGGHLVATQTTQYNHTDPNHPGDVTSVVDPDGHAWSYGYDAYGDKISVTDPLGNETAATYSADGWKLTSVSPRGNVSGCGCTSQYTTTYGYVDSISGKANEAGDLATVTDPLGHVTANHYDADRYLTSTTDGNGNTASYTFDLAHEHTVTTRANQTTLRTDYNSDGTVLDQYDGKGNAIITFGYDALGRVTASTDVLGNVTSYTYDGVGNRLTRQDPGGNCSASPKTGCTTMGYDADNELQ